MKTVADFKRNMQVGAKVNSFLFWADKEGNMQQQNAQLDRECTISQSNSFALTAVNSKGETVNSWCDWPKKAEFTPIDDNKAEIHFQGGKLIYEFL
jgi:hypothetical protein